MLENSRVAAFTVKLVENTNVENHKYSIYGVGFYACWSFSLSNGSEFGKNLIIFGANMSSSGHVDNRGKIF